MNDFVRVNDLTKLYEQNHVLAVDHVSFAVHEGEIFSLLGPNGAGKTTLISMLSGILRPTEGDAAIGEHSILREPLRAKRLIGIVPQDIALYPALSARENLRFWGTMYDLSGKELRDRVEEALELVGLRDRAKDRVEHFSGGMKRRLNIAAGLLHRPRLLFLDEPTVGIDPQSRRRILDMVKEFNAQGMTILYTTHYMEEAEELSHRIAVMDHGRIIALGTLDELRRIVGELETVRLTFRRDTPLDGLVQAAAALPQADRVTRGEDQIIVLTPDAARLLPDLVALIAREHLPLISLDIERPDLEAVFLHLTGRSLRD